MGEFFCNLLWKYGGQSGIIEFTYFSESCDEMEHTLRNRFLFFGPTLGLGLLSFYLHRTMMQTCIDGKGLLIDGNLPGRLLWLVGIGYALYLALMVRTIGGDGSYEDNFPPCILSGGLLIAGGVLMVTAVRAMELVPVWQYWLGLGAGGAMVIAGALRIFGKRPPFVLHGAVCVYFICIIIRNYQLWSADPQLHDYAYQLLAGVMLMLAAFQRTCCDALILQRRKLIVTGLAAAFFCLAALGDGNMPRFYLAAGLWAAGCVCNVAQFPADPTSEEEEAEPTA